MEQCIATDRLKAACRAVRHLQLSDEFPDVEALYRHRTVTRLVDKQLWSVAATIVGTDNDLQVPSITGILESSLATGPACRCCVPDLNQLQNFMELHESISDIVKGAYSRPQPPHIILKTRADSGNLMLPWSDEWNIGTGRTAMDVATVRRVASFPFPPSQVRLLREMVQAGQLQLAQDYCTQFGLPPGALVIDPEELEAERRRRREQHLQLQLPAERVTFVDRAEQLAAVGAALRAAAVIAVDVEWRPQHLAGAAASPASILQVGMGLGVGLGNGQAPFQYMRYGGCAWGKPRCRLSNPAFSTK